MNGKKRQGRPRKAPKGTRGAAKKGDVFEAQARELALLWGEAEPPSRGPKPSLSVDRVVQAAIEIADADGVHAVSMQRVSSEFGFTTMALYRYVPSKAELFALMIDAAIGEPPKLDGIQGGWRPRLEHWARRLWAVFHQHPWLLEATGSLRVMGPNELGWLDAALAALSGTGLAGRELMESFLVINGHVRIAAQFSVDIPRDEQALTKEQWVATVARLLETHGERYPALVSALSGGAFGPSESDGLEFGLRRVLDGIGMLIESRKQTSRGPASG
ncbi:TetR/AcrR family transcriptional regulator [Vitiosangium sp. GDMCC 1.1324]|uniref:TetR/AcrR family transcriptional regulator n=1 Tax=Vitiosangium sp. (strain GDMCC 1.1324) TaxID=2138576 RepID=UPI000D37AA0F|nr:TetR/AcrR family transcriptional regulator [Vitiosangium sp. GDMCC 1.1324]PTL85720.1 TetR family transcriptional regulator [Vitiosangium sp. GDMCC 1.1324]